MHTFDVDNRGHCAMVDIRKPEQSSTVSALLVALGRRLRSHTLPVLSLAPGDSDDKEKDENTGTSGDARDRSPASSSAPGSESGSGSESDSAPDPGSDGDTRAIEGRELAELLIEAEVVTDTEAGDDLRLTDQFADVWERRISRVREGDRAVQQFALALEVDPDELTVEEREGEFVARLRRNTLGKWPSEGAFVADIALYPTLGEWLPVWEDLDGQSRDELLGRLRAFLEVCPACDGDLQPIEKQEPESGGASVSLTCEACGEVAFRGAY